MSADLPARDRLLCSLVVGDGADAEGSGSAAHLRLAGEALPGRSGGENVEHVEFFVLGGEEKFASFEDVNAARSTVRAAAREGDGRVDLIAKISEGAAIRGFGANGVTVVEGFEDHSRHGRRGGAYDL